MTLVQAGGGGAGGVAEGRGQCSKVKEGRVLQQGEGGAGAAQSEGGTCRSWVKCHGNAAF